MTQDALVVPSIARTDARLTFPDGSVYSAPVGTPIRDFMRAAYPSGQLSGPIVAAVIDTDLRELTLPVVRDAVVKPVTLADSDGGRIYRRSLVFLMTTAAAELFPGIKLAVEHSLTEGGIYCQVLDRPQFAADQLDGLRTRMQQIIAEDAPIVRKTMPLAEAIAIFTARGDDDKVRLLEFRSKNYLTLYTLHENIDYFYGYMVPSTALLSVFDLCLAENGFILRFPRPESPAQLLPISGSHQLERIFRQTHEWLQVMGIDDVGRLNRAVRDGRIRETILIAEALHSRYLSQIAHRIADKHREGVRLVLIAGPSSAGKTTFSKRLAVQLMAHGIQPFTLAMDNYFVDRALTPLDEHGVYDFEALGALNREQLTADLLKLMNHEQVQLPRFDFMAGRSVPGDIAQLSHDSVIIAEGIHGLNPDLVPHVPAARIFRIYVSALTSLNIDRHNRIPTTDVRLLRRIVRDATHRGYSAQDTLNRWESVRRGEKRNIFPYQENADVMFNSGLAYELAVVRPLAEPLLLQVEPSSARYIEAKRLLAFLRWVRPASPDFVPDDSLLREFVGGSILETYVPGAQAP